jgi:hypothetical protein
VKINLFNKDNDVAKDCTEAYSFAHMGDCGFASGTASATKNIINIDKYPDSDHCTFGLGFTDLHTTIHNSRIQNFTKRERNTATNFEYKVNFDEENNIVSISQGKGFLRIRKDYQGFTSIVFSFWKAEDNFVNKIADYDRIDDKTFHTEFIKIQNNEVQLSSGFEESEAIVISEDDEFITIEINDLNLTQKISEDIDFEEELAVSVTSYIDADNDRVIKEELKNSQQTKNKITTDIAPNPSNGTFQFQITLEKEDNLEINLFNIEGKHIKMLYSGNVTPNQLMQFDLQEDNLTKGIYYITIQSKEGFQLKKLVLQ